MIYIVLLSHRSFCYLYYKPFKALQLFSVCGSASFLKKLLVLVSVGSCISLLLNTLVTFACPHAIGSSVHIQEKHFTPVHMLGLQSLLIMFKGPGISMVSILLNSFT